MISRIHNNSIPSREIKLIFDLKLILKFYEIGPWCYYDDKCRFREALMRGGSYKHNGTMEEAVFNKNEIK